MSASPQTEIVVKRVQPTLLVLSLLLSVLIPFATAKADDARKARSMGALTLPIAGTAIDAAGQQASFSGTLTINRFAEQNQQLVAIGFVRGTVTNGAGQAVKSGLQDVALPVNPGQRTASLGIPPSVAPRLMPASWTEAAGGRFILAQAQTCGILHLDIGGDSVDLLGFRFTLSPITLDISGDSAGPLGALVCQIVALLGTAANIVGLLNNLLGTLTGLLGGLI